MPVGQTHLEVLGHHAAEVVLEVLHQVLGALTYMAAPGWVAGRQGWEKADVGHEKKAGARVESASFWSSCQHRSRRT